MSDQLIVCVDLDGVLNLYDGWRGADYFHPPRPGAIEFLKALHERNFQVVVHTVRWAPHVWDWIRLHGLDAYVYSVTNEKLPAHVYIDDRAICFTGDFQSTLDRVATFRAHWESADAPQI
jgi:hypothetical protein